MRITAYINKLQPKEENFIRGDDYEREFIESKDKLTSPPVLAYLNFEEEFTLVAVSKTKLS